MPKAKAKREAPEEKGDYEFTLPAFDEKAFIRREVASAKASFYTVGLGVAAGIVAVLIQAFAGQERWWYGWAPLFGCLVLLKPLLLKMGFPEDITTPKALFGSYFMLFLTGLSVWILGVNLLP